MVVLCENLPATFFLVVKICCMYGILEEQICMNILPGWHLVTVVLGAGPGPGPATLEQLPCGSRHHGQTQRKIEVRRTDPEKDRGTYNIIYVPKIDDAYFDYEFKVGFFTTLPSYGVSFRKYTKQI
jgi:hypothetical protein